MMGSENKRDNILTRVCLGNISTCSQDGVWKIGVHFDTVLSRIYNHLILQ